LLLSPVLLLLHFAATDRNRMTVDKRTHWTSERESTGSIYVTQRLPENRGWSNYKLRQYASKSANHARILSALCKSVTGLPLPAGDRKNLCTHQPPQQAPANSQQGPML